MILVESQCQFVSIQSSDCLLDFWKIYYLGNCAERVGETGAKSNRGEM